MLYLLSYSSFNILFTSVLLLLIKYYSSLSCAKNSEKKLKQTDLKLTLCFNRKSNGRFNLDELISSFIIFVFMFHNKMFALVLLSIVTNSLDYI